MWTFQKTKSMGKNDFANGMENNQLKIYWSLAFVCVERPKGFYWGYVVSDFQFERRRIYIWICNDVGSSLEEVSWIWSFYFV